MSRPKRLSCPRRSYRPAIGMVLAFALTACSSSKPPLEMATASGPSAMGNATLQFVCPCPNSPFFDDKKGHQPFDILVDEKKAGAVFSCDYATMAIPAGTHPIRIQDPTLDLDGAFGRKGESFAVAPNETLYLLIPH